MEQKCKVCNSELFWEDHLVIILAVGRKVLHCKQCGWNDAEEIIKEPKWKKV